MPMSEVNRAPRRRLCSNVLSEFSSEFIGKTSKNCVSTAGMGIPTTNMIFPSMFKICAVAVPLVTRSWVATGTSLVEAPELWESH